MEETQTEPREREHYESSPNQNVGEGERYASILGGTALMLFALARRGLGGILAGGTGLALIGRGVTGQCALYKKLGVSSRHSTRPGVPDNTGIKVEQSITIGRSPGEIYRFWRDFSNLATFMKHLERVDVLDEKRSRWVIKGPAGRHVEWVGTIINEHPDRMIAWESEPGAEVENAGSVRFDPAPGGRGTEVKVSLAYNPPGGVLGALGAKLFGVSPEKEVEEDLARLKQILETGEVATTVGQATGRGIEEGVR